MAVRNDVSGCRAPNAAPLRSVDEPRQINSFDRLNSPHRRFAHSPIRSSQLIQPSSKYVGGNFSKARTELRCVAPEGARVEPVRSQLMSVADEPPFDLGMIVFRVELQPQYSFADGKRLIRKSWRLGKP
jgi:hypothetical protein